MTIANIVKEVDAEIAWLQQAKTLLSSVPSLPADRFAASRFSVAKKSRRKKRTLSPEARKKIADAQRKRWAAQKAKK